MEDDNEDFRSISDVASRVAARLGRRSATSILLATIVVLFLISLGALVFAPDLASLVYGFDYTPRYMERFSALIRLYGFMGLIFALGLVTYLYTRGISLLPRRQPESIDDAAIRSLAYIADSMRSSVEEIKKNRVLTDVEQKAITSSLSDVIKQSVTNDFLKQIDAKYGGAIQSENLITAIRSSWEAIEKRLRDFQKDTSNKASAALAWGVGTGTAGLAILVYFIAAGVHPSDSGLAGAIFHYTARLSLVGVVEAVAFFFLRLYRDTLRDEKYVNNELTNAEFRLLALSVAVQSNDKEAVSKVVTDFSRTERNFALKDGEVAAFPISPPDVMPSASVMELLGKLLPVLKLGGSGN